MQLQFRTHIHRSVSDVWAAFVKAENLKLWQSDLKSIRHIEGSPRQEGAISEVTCIQDGREIVMRERIRYRQEGVAMDFEYTCPLFVSRIENRFLPAEGGTMWIVEIDYRFQGMYWFLSLFMRSKMESRWRRDLNRFKALVEKAEKR
jgi:uncharacterized membrane protein